MVAILAREDCEVGGVFCLPKNIVRPIILCEGFTNKLKETTRTHNVRFGVTTPCRVGVFKPDRIV